jgi:hypothetical protein
MHKAQVRSEAGESSIGVAIAIEIDIEIESVQFVPRFDSITDTDTDFDFDLSDGANPNLGFVHNLIHQWNRVLNYQRTGENQIGTAWTSWERYVVVWGLGVFVWRKNPP